jgi:hypothetical protein
MFRWWRKKLKRRCGSGRDNNKKRLCCGFQTSDKAMGQGYQCLWRICREINFFSSFQYHMFYFLYPFVTYLLTVRRSPYCFRINGSIQNLVSTLYPNDVNKQGPNVLNFRLRWKGKEGLMSEATQWFDRMLRPVKQFAKSYKHMYKMKLNTWINKWNAFIIN